MKKIAVFCSASFNIDKKYNVVAREFVRKAALHVKSAGIVKLGELPFIAWQGFVAAIPAVGEVVDSRINCILELTVILLLSTIVVVNTVIAYYVCIEWSRISKAIG